jgi:hypothetical protein
MDTQLRLLSHPDTDPDWRLDDATRRTGLEGIEHARAALVAARRPAPKARDHHDDAPDGHDGHPDQPDHAGHRSAA